MTVGTPLSYVLERFLNVASQRSQLVTTNMANIDTPGYRTRDLDFQSELRRALLDSTDTAAMPAVRSVQGLVERPDGNNVSLDREGLLLAETQMQFRLGVQLIKGEFHRLLTAINEGRSA